jgi:tol-pal system protein YbgF
MTFAQRVAALLFAAMFATAGSARAGLFDDDEARARVEQTRAQLADLTKQVESINRNQLDFANQVETIKAEVAKLNGQVEVLTYELEAAQKRQKDFYVDLDSRLRKLESPAETKAETATKIDPAVETRDYETAVTALKASQYKEAGAGFIAFIKNYPASSLIASAHYWGGYAHAQLKDHVRAAELFGQFAAKWPDDERAPGAMESQVFSLEAQKDVKGARAVLVQLAAKYPNSPAGKKAQQRLKNK